MKSRQKIYFLYLPLLLCILLWACQSQENRDVSGSRPETFDRHCISCHGADLKGEIAQSLLDGSWQFGSRRNDIFRSIKFGHPHHGMPSWGNVLTEEEMDTLAGYLLAEEKRLGIAKPALPDSLETQDYLVSIEVVAKDLQTPWSIAFLQENKALITEKSGLLRIWENGELLTEPVKGIPEVRDQGQGGLLDVAVDPEYSENGWIYLAYSHALEKTGTDENAPGMTKIVRGKLQGNQWTEEQTLFEAEHDTYRTTSHHFGSRIVFDPQGYLYFSIGDRGAGEHAQDLSRPNGKIHRIQRDGSIPASNPFYGRKDAVQSIYSYGHRNPQGMAVHPVTGQVWATEHGPLGGDELNLILPGGNYGWPEISYGINYNGEIITDLNRKEGMEQPIYYWKPSIAACGLDFYSGDLFPRWKNQLMAGALKFEEVQLLDIEKDRVMYQQTLLKNHGRVRDLTTGPEGAIYIVLNNPGMIIRLIPRPVM